MMRCRCGQRFWNLDGDLDRPGDLLPLNAAKPGGRVRVKRINGGRSLCARMAALGIYPGAEVELVCTACEAPCIVKVHGSTLSLGAGVSSKILVAPLSAGS